MTSSPVLRLANVRRAYNGLRPLRINDLSIAAGERVALSGLDAGAAEVLVNLVTGASIPDEGEVLVLGQSTASISDGEAWLASLDRFGIVSPRAVLLDAATLLQNLAMPITPWTSSRCRRTSPRRSFSSRAMSASRSNGSNGPSPRSMRPFRCAHLARAIALNPSLLILEHPTARLAAGEGKAFGAVVASVAGARTLATLIISEDVEFSTAAATRRLALQGATGDLKPKRRFFGF